MTARELFLKELAASRLRRATRMLPPPRKLPPPSSFSSRAEYDRAYYRVNRDRKLAAANARYRAIREASRG